LSSFYGRNRMSATSIGRLRLRLPSLYPNQGSSHSTENCAAFFLVLMCAAKAAHSEQGNRNYLIQNNLLITISRLTEG
jgi:hypothetical protein